MLNRQSRSSFTRYFTAKASRFEVPTCMVSARRDSQRIWMTIRSIIAASLHEFSNLPDFRRVNHVIYTPAKHDPLWFGGPKRKAMVLIAINSKHIKSQTTCRAISNTRKLSDSGSDIFESQHEVADWLISRIGMRTDFCDFEIQFQFWRGSLSESLFDLKVFHRKCSGPNTQIKLPVFS